MCRYASYGESSPISDDDDGGDKFVFFYFDRFDKKGLQGAHFNRVLCAYLLPT